MPNAQCLLPNAYLHKMHNLHNLEYVKIPAPPGNDLHQQPFPSAPCPLIDDDNINNNDDNDAT